MSGTVTITLDRNEVKWTLEQAERVIGDAADWVAPSWLTFRDKLRAALEEGDHPQASVPPCTCRYATATYNLMHERSCPRWKPGPEDAATPDQPQVPSGPLGDEERERLRGIAERAGEGRLLDDPELIFLRRLADQPPTEERLREKLTEFDAWLSFRGEFSEVLTAFRQSFGTDTSVAALTEKASGDREGGGQ